MRDQIIVQIFMQIIITWFEIPLRKLTTNWYKTFATTYRPLKPVITQNVEDMWSLSLMLGGFPMFTASCEYSTEADGYNGR